MKRRIVLVEAQMSERYGDCRRCHGCGKVPTNRGPEECPRCDGTGHSGDAMDAGE